MRKIKVNVQCRVPSWNFCNHDGHTSTRASKELCRFCVSTKAGKWCLLYDKPLASDISFVYKHDVCIDASAGFATEAAEDSMPIVDPKLIIKEAIKSYKNVVANLVAQGYPQQMAETIATKHILEE